MLAIDLHNTVMEKAKDTLKNVIEIKSIKIGQHVRQGDIYITAIKDITGKKEISNRQLALGSTKGSRHILETHDDIKIFDACCFNVVNEVKGPQIQAKKSFTITHPEHADYVLPEGNYQVTYQYDWLKQSNVRD